MYRFWAHGPTSSACVHLENAPTQFGAYVIYFSVVIVRPFPGLPAPLHLAGPPGSAFTLCGTVSLVCRTASSSSAFLLPFPLPLAGASAERRGQGADPVAAAAGGGEEKKKKWMYPGWRMTGRQTVRAQSDAKTLKVLNLWQEVHDEQLTSCSRLDSRLFLALQLSSPVLLLLFSVLLHPRPPP